MNRAILIAQREYMENVRTRGFWMGIMMLPVILLLLAVIPLVVEETREAKTYAVIDQSGWLHQAIQREINIDDLSEVLLAVVGKQQRRVPDMLMPLSVIEPPVDKHRAHDLARRIIEGPGAPVSLPSTYETYLISNDVRQWWSDESTADRATWSSRLSTRQFLLQPSSLTAPEMNEQIQAGSLFAYFIISPDPLTASAESRYVSNNLTDRDLLNWYTVYGDRLIRNARLERENIKAEVAERINTPLSFVGVKVTGTGSQETINRDDIARQWAPVAFVYLLWFSILINTQMLLTNTIEEKSNKLVEVLLSSVSPITLMTGKIAGIAATGLTIILTWATLGLAFFMIIPGVLNITLPIDFSSILADRILLGSFLVYFILGYLLYAALLVGLGSVCSTLKEAQNMMLPVQLIQMIPIFVMVPIGRDPNGLLAQILSYVPPLTPFVMMNRAAAPPSTFEYVVTTGLLVISIVLAMWVAAKIFRIGILMTGKRPGFMQILRLLRAPVADQPLGS